MLKYRLIFGTIMIAAFLGLAVFDGYLDGSICQNSKEIFQFKGIIISGLFVILAIVAMLEIRTLFSKAGVKIFLPTSIPLTILIGTAWASAQLIIMAYPNISPEKIRLVACLLFAAVAIWATFLYQALKFGTDNVIKNCSANIFAIFYIGFLAGFILAIRIDFGVWALLMYIFTIKSSDIGAYTAGRLFGKHKFSPSISPGKTWEGVVGAVIFSAIVASLFAHFLYIIPLWTAALFGAAMAFLGQLSDLAESMIKRDAQQKDSSNSVPGFGGILDIIDSLMMPAPVAYAVFCYFTGNI